MRLISFLLVILTFVSCKKDEVEEPVNTDLKNGILVLCEGLFQQNNASVSFVNLTDNSIETQFFEKNTGRSLGDTGNDLFRYGGKVYITVNVSSTVEVLNAKDFSSLKQISMIEGGISKQPRNMVGFGGKVYITCFDGYVDVLDTTSLTITTRIPVGLNPDGLAISGSKLFVGNSGGLNAPTMDSTISVIDLSTNQEIDKITVGLNPGAIAVDNTGEVYVVTRGNYSNIPSRLNRIDPNTLTLIEQFTFDVSGITRMNQNFLISFYDYNSQQSSIALFDPGSEQLINANFVDLSAVSTLYNVNYSVAKDHIYVMDAMNYVNTGYVREFSSNGSLITSYQVGLNPTKMVVYE